ncbi:protein transport protein Sec16B [Sphaerodactylus townsendi]|uniref:protein transport protein Sec16B n=1 Tax=Sphaerodactylus townsendi TaxID=933632 RepID=UPI00202630D3|nr:protein transport protein Sec16B [Sphaerodactylus townsendi]
MRSRSSKSKMESQIPAQHPQPKGRSITQKEEQGRGPWREVSRGPSPHSRPQNERFYHQYQDPRAGPPPWSDARMDYYHPTYHPQLQDYMRPHSRAEYYENSYLNRPYSRQSYEDQYWSPVEDYSYGSHQRYSQALQGDRDLRQRNTYGEYADYWNQSHYRDYRQEESSRIVRQNNATPIRSKKHESYKDGYGAQEDSSYDINYGPSLQQGWIPNELQGISLENLGAQMHEVPVLEEPSLLQQYKESGLSSSAYELSQYIYDASNPYEAAPSKDWSPVQTGEYIPAPQKFPLSHVPVCFGAGGHLVRGCPNYPTEGQPALVEIHSLEVILYDTAEQKAMQVFPGPLIREDLHKVDVMTFCQRKATAGCDQASNRGRDATLLWKLLLLLCRQNGSMVGSDIAELLMQDCRYREKYKRQEPVANLINLTEEEWPVQVCGTPDLLTGEIVPSAGTPKQNVEKFTRLLYYGRKKEALDWAMRSQLWGHALFLSSKMDLRTYSWVLNGFTSTLAPNDPLQTLFQLMSGRIPQASLCCGDDKWGDWRPHLGVILSNQVGDAELNHRAVVTMGDTLAGKGLTEAAHFCYLMGNIPFGHFGVKTQPHMILLGSNQSQALAQFVKLEDIHRTEIFEYCQLLGDPKAFIPSFQMYKLIYAARLVDYGLTAQALHYCEGAGMALLAQNGNTNPVLLQQVIQLAERLKLSDPRLLESPEQDGSLEPDWLIQLRALHQQSKEEGSLPGATSTQPELVKNSGSIPDMAPYSEHVQSQGCLGDFRQHPSNQLPPVESTQYQPSLDQRLHLHPGSDCPANATVTRDGEWRVEQHQPSSFSSSGGLPDDLSSHLRQSSGDAQESGGGYYTGQEQNLKENQNTLKTRTRSISQSSTISMVEDVSQLSEDTVEESISESEEAENAGKEQAKVSGFGWFQWFRSKPKNTELSQKAPNAPLDLAVSDPQGKVTLPPSSPPPMGGIRPPSLPPPPPPHLPHADGNPFPQNILGNPRTKNQLDLGTKEGGIFPRARNQDIPSDPHPDSAMRPLTLKGGTVPLFNPSQVTVAAVSGQPPQSFQRRYPPYPQ